MYIKLKTLNLVILMLTAFSFIIMAAPPELHVVGTQLQTVSGGCPVRLAGVDVDGLEWSPANDGANGQIANSVTGAISNWHANFVRIPISQDFWYGYKNTHGQPSSAAAYIAFVDSAVAAASNANCYAEVDLHWSGTGSFGTSDAQEDMPDDNSTTFWKDVATHYANNPAVFFDLYNEPKDDSWATWKGGGTSLSGFHTPGFQALVKTVRDTGAKNVIVIGGLGWAWDMTGISANSITDTNTAGNMSGDGIMYEAHIYDNKGGSTEAQKIALWNSNVSVAVQAGFCVDIGEFGPMTDGSQDASGCTPFESDLISWINGNNTAAPGNKSYVFNAMAWDFNTGAGPLLLSSFTNFTATGCHGTQVKNWLAAITPVSCGATTPTFTRTNTFTATRTPTTTATRSATQTATRTFTPTFTVTFTSTVPSATPIFTKTFTATDTPTFTSTVPSATPSFTRTFTATATVTTTSTVSSLTPTFTLTSTQSFTATKTFTPTNIVTATVTPTTTLTQVNPTATFTGTNTAIVPSATFTSTAVDTATPANTMSPTQQPPSATITGMPSATVTQTFVYAQTATQTTAPTQPDTATPTFTFTTVPPTSTSTNTWTAVATATSTYTQTWTQVNTSTTVPTLTWTFTPTYTPSYTDTPTSVPTFGITPVGTLGIFKPVLYLNQNSTNMTVEMTVPVAASEVEVIIYTKAFRKVVDTKYTSGLTFPQMNLKMIEGITDNFARGVYYYVVIYTDVNGKVTKSKINAFIIAR